MKKTLIAIAALAATGAFAQVTLTGNYTYGFSATKDAKPAQNEASGFGVDTAEVNFNATEDLGSGQKIDVAMSLGSLVRSSTGAQGQDNKISYTNTSFGRVELGNAKAANYFAGIASAGAPVIDFDGKLFETRSSNDYISYAALLGPVAVRLSHNESSKGLGLGAGVQGLPSTVGQRNNTIVVLYSAAALQLAAAYRAYDNQSPGNLTSGAPGFLQYASGTKNNVVNAQGSYDFGFLKLGAGFQQANASNGVTVVDWLVGASAPLSSAWTVGATFASSTASDAKNTAAFGWDLSKYNGTATGYSLGASYALSKRTSITTKYARWTHSGYSQYEADGAASGASQGLGYDRTASETSVLLSHSF